MGNVVVVVLVVVVEVVLVVEVEVVVVDVVEVVVVDVVDVVCGMPSVVKADSGTMLQSDQSLSNCQNSIAQVPPPFS